MKGELRSELTNSPSHHVKHEGYSPAIDKTKRVIKAKTTICQNHIFFVFDNELDDLDPLETQNMLIFLIKVQT